MRASSHCYLNVKKHENENLKMMKVDNLQTLFMVGKVFACNGS